MTLGMLSAGELSDTVPQMVGKIADVMDTDLDSTIQKLSTLMEPMMIIIMGLAIMLIMVAILLPMYNLTRQLQM
jgi:type II secretory pathway component PulF